jgi:hypothetical protein
MSQHDLTRQLQSFSISSEEEKVTQKLTNTYLEPTLITSIFSIPKTPQTTQTPQAPQQSTFPSHSIQETNATDWSTKNTSWILNDAQTQDDDGWGAGPPSYTSISQGTYFGFNSIITPIIDNSSNSTELHNTQAFSRFKNKPVSFNSALEDQ